MKVSFETRTMRMRALIARVLFGVSAMHSNETDRGTWVTPSQFCEAFSISKATFWRLVAAGKVETIKLGARCTRVRLDRLPEAGREVA
jgi:hypothetical protein